MKSDPNSMPVWNNSFLFQRWPQELIDLYDGTVKIWTRVGRLRVRMNYAAVILLALLAAFMLSAFLLKDWDGKWFLLTSAGISTFVLGKFFDGYEKVYDQYDRQRVDFEKAVLNAGDQCHWVVSVVLVPGINQVLVVYLGRNGTFVPELVEDSTPIEFHQRIYQHLHRLANEKETLFPKRVIMSANSSADEDIHAILRRLFARIKEDTHFVIRANPDRVSLTSLPSQIWA